MLDFFFTLIFLLRLYHKSRISLTRFSTSNYRDSTLIDVFFDEKNIEVWESIDDLKSVEYI